MAIPEIEMEINALEDKYAEQLSQHANIGSLSSLWQRIKELKAELLRRNEKA